MAGLASLACEGVPRGDIAVLRVGLEGSCGQSDCERHGTSCLAHGHSPWRLILIETSSHRTYLNPQGLGRAAAGME